MQRADVEPGRGLHRVVDPHGHADHVQGPHPAGVHPFPGALGRRREAVVEVDRVRQVLRRGQLDHLAALVDAVGDGLLAQHRDACFEQLHGRSEVVAAVLLSLGADAAGGQLDAAGQHVGDGIERPRAVRVGKLRGALLVDVADRDHVAPGMLGVCLRVAGTDAARADDADVHVAAEPTTVPAERYR